MSDASAYNCPTCGEELEYTDEDGFFHRTDGLTVAECQADHLAYIRERTEWGEQVERGNGDGDHQEEERERTEPAG